MDGVIREANVRVLGRVLELLSANGLKTFENIYCHSLSVQYNTIQCYLSTECPQNQFLFLKDCTSKHVGRIVSYKGF